MGRWKLFALALAGVLTMAMIGGSNRADEVSKAYGFRVEISGLEPMAVRAVDGIALNLKVEELEVPGETIVRKLPGRLKYDNITLKRGLVSESPFFEWLDDVRLGRGAPARRDISITILDRQGSDVRTLDYQQCFLSGYELAPLDTPGAGEGLEERVTFSCDLIETGRG
jgi:phage tail-like protein